MIELAGGEQRELNVELTPVIAPVALSIYDVFIRSNYDPPSAADNFIHARIRNNGAVVQTRQITAHYWESWMAPDDVPGKTQTITVNPGQTIEYTKHFHGNDHTKYQMAIWLTGDWIEEPLTRQFPFHAGFHLRPSVGDPKVEAHIIEVGSDYVIIRYAEFGTCTTWEYLIYTPPDPLEKEQKLRAIWRTPWAYCGFWLVPGLLPGRLYEAHMEGRRETWIRFTTGG